MQKEGLKEKLHYARLGILASVPEAIAFCNAIVVQAAEAAEAEAGSNSGSNVTQKIQNSSNSIWNTMKIIAISLIVVVLSVCGITLIVGTQKMKEAIKEHFYSIVIGVLILFLSKDIAEYLEDTFG